jgi:hypothetical protein
LSWTPAIDATGVVGIEPGEFEGTTIRCAYSALDGAVLSPLGLRQELTRLLPAYMLPAHRIEHTAQERQRQDRPQGAAEPLRANLSAAIGAQNTAATSMAAT